MFIVLLLSCLCKTLWTASAYKMCYINQIVLPCLTGVANWTFWRGLSHPSHSSSNAPEHDLQKWLRVPWKQLNLFNKLYYHLLFQGDWRNASKANLPKTTVVLEFNVLFSLKCKVTLHLCWSVLQFLLVPWLNQAGGSSHSHARRNLNLRFFMRSQLSMAVTLGTKHTQAVIPLQTIWTAS